MLKKFISTLITGAICLSTTSAFAVNNRVQLISKCVAYTDNGSVAFSDLRLNDLYYVVKPMVFRNGENGVKIWIYHWGSRRYFQGNISNRCVRSSGGRVLFF